MKGKNTIKLPNIEVVGFISCEVLKNGEIVEYLPPFQNLILDQGLDFLGKGTGTYLDNCQVGTGTSTPTTSDVGLETRIGGQGRDGFYSGSINTTEHYVYINTVYTFSTGEVVGDITEAGVGIGSTAGSQLFSRTLLKDGGGAPTSISIAADQQLRLYYEFRVYQPTVDMFNGTVDGYQVVSRTARANSHSYNYAQGWWLSTSGSSASREISLVKGYRAYVYFLAGEINAAITGYPSGNSLASYSLGNSETTEATYIDGTYYKDLTFTVPIDGGNDVTGIGAMYITYGPTCFQFGFTPHIMKTEFDKLIITFRYTWARKAIP